MSMQTRLAALIEAIAADIKELVIGKVSTSDSRLSNSREWNAATVPRAEAEAGTAATRRAWTAARVRQAIRAAILGTVSQEAGVPTGAIIERGSNANGEYVRFADGTLICTRILFIDSTVAPNERKALGMWALPAALVPDIDASPTIHVSIGNQHFIAGVTDPPAHGYTSGLWIRNMATETQTLSNARLMITVIGRWF